MPITNRIADFHPEMTAWRRDFHAHPELGYEEHRTAEVVAAKLAEWGIEVTRGLGGTGVVGTLRNGTGSRAIGLRADMDALPMQEDNAFEHKSENAGKMHACGHDGHTTMLLGAAKYLAESRNFDGTVHFFFQPAEEGGCGARAMIEDGLFEKFPVDQVYAMHNDTGLPLGRASVTAGPVQAASDRFWITVKGRGGHAARPHGAIDPVLIGAHVLIALQSIPARRVNPLESVVISTCQFHAGSANNVIPNDAVLSGTVRTLQPHVQDLVEEAIKAIATSTAAAHGATAEVVYTRGAPPTINHAAEADRAAAAMHRLLGQDNVVRERPPSMGAEDFAFMLNARPGAYVKMGQGGDWPVHHPRYDFNDELLPLGASFFAQLVEQELPR